MTSFKNYITEDGVNTTQQSPSIDGTDINPAALENPSVVRALNAYVGAIARQAHELPEQAINHIRQKLMRVGINFGDVQFTGEEGEISVPLVKHGGVYGKDTDSAPEEIVNETESGRSINFVFEKLATGTHKVFAQIS